MIKPMMNLYVPLLGAMLALTVLSFNAQAQSGRNPYRPADGLQAGSGRGVIGQGWA